MIRSWKMAKEKDEEMERESKGSNLIQLRVSDKTKSELQLLADNVGMPLTTYIYVLIAETIERKNPLK
jgi:antitoxin component of RelBE/YafQ-DinJ toxin-antitoxin module